MIDVTKMGNFANISGNSATIYNQGANGKIQSGGTYKGPLGALRRSEGEKAANNAARSELLVALADTYGMGDAYKRQADGRIQFTPTFIANLKERISDDMAKTLGLDSKFKMDGKGYVICGKPLTERRISAVNAQMRKELTNASKNEMKALKDVLTAIDPRLALPVSGGKTGVDKCVEDLIDRTNGKWEKVEFCHIKSAVKSALEKVDDNPKNKSKAKEEPSFPSTKEGKDSVVDAAQKLLKKRAAVEYHAKHAHSISAHVEEAEKEASTKSNTSLSEKYPDIFGQSQEQSMQMTKDIEAINNELEIICNGAKNHQHDEGAMNYLAGECVKRSQTWVIGEDTLNGGDLKRAVGQGTDLQREDAAKKLFNDKLKAFFGGDEKASVFSYFIQQGGNRADMLVQTAVQKGHVPQFGFLPTLAEDVLPDSASTMKLERLQNGHYKFTSVIEMKAVSHLFELDADSTLHQCDADKVKENYYSYSSVCEFYIEDGKPVVKLTEAPALKWKFADFYSA